MAETALTFLLGQLKEAVIELKDLISGAENEFEQLNNYLDMLKAFLKKTARMAEKDDLLTKLERRIKEIVCEAEDTIDICFTDAIQAKNKKASFSLSNLKPKSRLKLAKLVNSFIHDKLKPLFEDIDKCNRMQNFAAGSGGFPDLHAKSKKDTPIRRNRVVGFEDEERTITDFLKQGTSELDVISIIGVPGQGKTTLTWKIYENEEISFLFAIRIWVSISQKFNSRDVFLQILRKFTSNPDTSNLDNNELVQTVRACLEKETFLLVLDDVWSVDAWNEIKEVLPLSNGKGKVLITSRDMDVGMHSASEFRKPHTLRFLRDDESWTLLQYEVFGVEDCPQELKDIGYHIAVKCDGVPLTIVVIGGILMDLLTRSPSGLPIDEWKAVAKNVSEALQKDKAQLITRVVALSYNRLPDDLRECFVYLGAFPEDYEIPAKWLCELWMAEGFVLPKGGRSLEESAEDNLNDLICRNLLKVEKTNHTGKVKTCRVHDMIRAFCIALSKEENLFQEIKKSSTGALEPPVSEVHKFRRLCFRSDLSKFLSENPSGPHVRSFLCFYDQPVELEPQFMAVIPDSFPKLRILESKAIKFDKFPAKVTKLIHLRYLTLSIDTLKILPEAISQLWNLQALVVETKSRSITMKANMWRMIRLRHLKTKAAISLDSKWEGDAGQNIHTLNRLSPESCTEVVSIKAKNLKTLGISGKLANIFESKFLEKLHQLEKLKLVNSSTYEPTSEDMLHGLPQSNRFPPYLKRLTLTNTFLDWKHMSALATIKSLEALKLKDNAFLGVTWKVSGYDFPSLHLLLIVNTDLVIWEASTDSFPSLKFLVVKNCENLKEIPECLGTHLQRLEIERLRHSAVESAKRIEETNKKKPQGKFTVQFNLNIGPACLTK